MENIGLKRMTSLLIELLQLHSKHILDLDLVGTEKIGDELILHVEHGTPTPRTSAVDAKAWRAFFCYNACTTSLRIFAPLLAFLLPGLDPYIRVFETHIHRVVPTERIRLINNSENTTQRIADYHSVLQVCRNGCEDLFIDTTAPQYGEEPGLRRAACEVEHQSLRPENPTYETLGTVYLRHLFKLDALRSPFNEQAHWARLEVLRDEIFTLLINTIVYHVLCEYAGSTHFSMVTDAEWAYLQDHILERLDRLLAEARWDLANLCANKAGVELEEAYKDYLRVGMMFPGHRDFVGALAYARGEPWILDFLHI